MNAMVGFTGFTISFQSFDIFKDGRLGGGAQNCSVRKHSLITHTAISILLMTGYKSVNAVI